MRGMRGVGQKTPCPDAVCAGRLKTSRPTTNSTLIDVLRFRALLGTKIGLLGVCLFNGRILLVILKVLSIVPRLDLHCRSKSIEKPTQ